MRRIRTTEIITAKGKPLDAGAISETGSTATDSGTEGAIAGAAPKLLAAESVTVVGACTRIPQLVQKRAPSSRDLPQPLQILMFLDLGPLDPDWPEYSAAQLLQANTRSRPRAKSGRIAQSSKLARCRLSLLRVLLRGFRKTSRPRSADVIRHAQSQQYQQEEEPGDDRNLGHLG
jgi:hypothetical protein